MKNSTTYIVFVIFFLAIGSLLLYRKDQKPDFTFVERIEGGNASTEWQNAKAAIEGMLTELKKNPDNSKTKLKLALAYINESRVTGKHAYYDAAALALLHDIPKTDNNYFDVQCAMTTVQLSQHHFDEALVTGKMLIEQNPYSAFAQGVITDAHLELGNYEAAIQAADKMVALRPDIRSYARVAYLREITGDVAGAIEVMKMAVAAGIPGFEQTEWCRYQLGKLYESSGDIAAASETYINSLQLRKNFPYALAGLANLAAHKGNYQDAIKLYTQAKSFTDDYAFTESLYELYTLTNQPSNAAKAHAECLSMLGAASGDESEKFHGHYADKELAEFYCKINNYEAALKHASIERNRRPQNIEINRVLAWIYYKTNNLKLADEHLTKALSTASTNPNLLLQASLIKKALGQNETAKQYYAAVPLHSSVIQPTLLAETKAAFHQTLVQK